MNKLLLSRSPDLNQQGLIDGHLVSCAWHFRSVLLFYTGLNPAEEESWQNVRNVCGSYLASHGACLSTDCEARTCSHAHDRIHALLLHRCIDRFSCKRTGLVMQTDGHTKRTPTEIKTTRNGHWSRNVQRKRNSCEAYLLTVQRGLS